jgi:hypothetical protein
MSPTAPIALWLGLPFLVVVGCGAGKGTGEAAGSEAGELTYYADTKQILDAKCATCHRPGDIGPFPLTAYAEVRDFEAAVRSSIENNTMPPWKPSDDCNEYIGNIDLSAKERSTLLAWLESGAPAGDPADAPSPSGGSSFEDWTADLTLQLPEPYTPQLEPDDCRCQLIAWPYEEPVYVTGLRVIPDQRSIVHHTIAFLIGPGQVEQFRAWDAQEAGPGYTCYGGPTASSSGGTAGDIEPADLRAALDALGLTIADLQSGSVTPEQLAALLEALGLTGRIGFTSLGSWVPGTPSLPLPAGTGIRVEPGSMVVAQMHYNTMSSAPLADQSTIELSIAASVEREATLLQAIDVGWVTNGLFGDPMTIPAGDPEVTHSTTLAYDSLFVQAALPTLGLEAGAPLVIHSANHHMHALGTRQTSTVQHADGTSSCLLDIPDWDFNWQGAYQLAEPVTLAPGDALEMRCSWDNSAANQPVVNGEVRAPAEVSWGESTTDEMCLGAFYVTGQ